VRNNYLVSQAKPAQSPGKSLLHGKKRRAEEIVKRFVCPPKAESFIKTDSGIEERCGAEEQPRVTSAAGPFL
jgi:hypothetical protein